MDVLDVFVRAGQSISRGDQVIRSYRCVIFFLIFADLSLSIFRPALDNQESIILHIFSTEEESDTDMKVSFSTPINCLNIFYKFVTDANVQLCGTLSLSTSDNSLSSPLPVVADHQNEEMSREIQVRFAFYCDKNQDNICRSK